LSLGDHNKDGYMAKGIIHHCKNCNVRYGVVEIELTRDGGLCEEMVRCPCGQLHGAQMALDIGELDQTQTPNYIMTDPGYHSEEIYADDDDLAICQMIRWAEIDGYPYSGHFTLRRIDSDGDQGETVYEHESERGGEQD